jgi:hypothetical protein
MMELRAAPSREGVHHEATGIYVRALNSEGKWSNLDIAELNLDIAELNLDSLNVWLKSRGGDNPWAESVVRILLGHTR